MESKKVSFTAAVKKHLSLPAETVNDLAEQLKLLNQSDRESLHSDLLAAGVDCEPPGTPAK